MQNVTQEIRLYRPDSIIGRRILIVEDVPAELFRLETMLKTLGYQVTAANSGEEALSLLETSLVDLILCDWQMPGISGVELCKKVKSRFGNEAPYIILVTGCDTHSELVTGMEAGADDYITKPYNREEMRVRVNSGSRLIEMRAASQQQTRELANALKRENEARRIIQDDLAMASEVQRKLLPSLSARMGPVRFGALYEPCTSVAGDSFHYFPIGANQIAFYQIDVSGHGVAAAMLAVAVSHFLLRESNTTTADQKATMPSRPSSVVNLLNQKFLDQSGSRYFTMIYGTLDLDTGEGLLCQAGHPHPIIVGKGGHTRKLGVGGFPVGMLDGAEYEDIKFRLHQRDRLYLFSDGLPESSNANKTQLGYERLYTIFKNAEDIPLEQSIAWIQSRLDNWCKNTHPDDDRSMLVLEYQDEA